MNFGIIAAGEGSRLVQEGVSTPKPLLRIDGMPMIERLIRIFERNGAESINVVVNGFMTEVNDFLKNLKLKDGISLNIKVRTTPSSMHTFFELTKMLRGKGKFITTTVDTIFREKDFAGYVETFDKAPGDIDGMMAVTNFIEDEKPLYVTTDNEMQILSFDDEPRPGTEFISGGIYGLNSHSIPVLEECLAKGMSRMRNFQRELVKSGLVLKAYPMGKIIDVDHVSDLETAERFLKV